MKFICLNVIFAFLKQNTNTIFLNKTIKIKKFISFYAIKFSILKIYIKIILLYIKYKYFFYIFFKWFVLYLFIIKILYKVIFKKYIIRIMWKNNVSLFFIMIFIFLKNLPYSLEMKKIKNVMLHFKINII